MDDISFFVFGFIDIYTYESLLVKEISKTTLSIYIYIFVESVSCHVSLSHYVSIYLSLYIFILIDSSNQAGSSNVTEKGGSKYGVHQGNGTNWMIYHFLFFDLYIYICIHIYESLLVKEISKTT